MSDKNAAFEQIDSEIFPAVIDCLQRGLLVVLIGDSGTGKSVLAKKAIADGMVAEELHREVVTNEFIQQRDQAITHGLGAIFTAQLWEEVVPFLKNLKPVQYKVFDLNLVWALHGRRHLSPNSIPLGVLWAAEELTSRLFQMSPVGKLISAIKKFAEGRKRDIERGAETPALASLMVEKYGYGLMKAADVLDVVDSRLLTDEVDRLVAEIDPLYRKNQQYRWESRPAGLSIANQDGTNQRIV